MSSLLANRSNAVFTGLNAHHFRYYPTKNVGNVLIPIPTVGSMVLNYPNHKPKVSEVVNAFRMFKTITDPNVLVWLTSSCDPTDDKAYRAWKQAWKMTYKNLSGVICFLKKLRKVTYLRDVEEQLKDPAFVSFQQFVYSETVFQNMTKQASRVANQMLIILEKNKMARKYHDMTVMMTEIAKAVDNASPEVLDTLYTSIDKIKEKAA